MTPKEKAESLVLAFKHYASHNIQLLNSRYSADYSKECALICVEEIQSVITRHDSEYVWNYWKQVKTEIEKL